MNKYIMLILMLIMHGNIIAKDQQAKEKITNLITPVSYFVNHINQLQNLQENLEKYRKSSVVGTSGIGKTQLVRTYAYESRNNYEIIWFIDCNLDINQEFIKLAKALNQQRQANIIEEGNVVKAGVLEYLRGKNNWLLVFDNLKINDNKKIQEIVDWEHNGHVIFASQDGQLLPNTIKITSFINNDSIALASNLLEVKDKDDIDFLGKAFNGYPILIIQGTQLLNQVKGLDKEVYMEKVYKSVDKIKLNVELAMQELTPSAFQLVSKIALINNQSFSKFLLKIITDHPDNLDDDIFQLSKFVLITNTDSNGNDPIFEMHDIIAQKIVEFNGSMKNKNNLEDIITKLMSAVPKSVFKGRIFRNSDTMTENFVVIARNSESYNINIYKMMELNSNLGRHYNNSLDYDNAEKKLEWLEENDKKGKFKLLLMNNDEKSMYASYLSMIGHYFRHRYLDYNKAVEYFVRATDVFDNVEGYESYKFNVIAQLTVINATLGQIQAAEKSITKLEEIIAGGFIDKWDANFIYTVKSKLSFIQGRYQQALELVDQFIKIVIKEGLRPDDLFLTNSYLLKSEILNFLEKYHKAYVQAEQLYNMHKPTKKEDHLIFGRIYTQMAKSELGLGRIVEAKGHIKKAIAIFLADEQRNPKDADYSEDPDLAASYVVQGDILVAKDELKQAIESYRYAQKIYLYLYKNNRKNIAQVSYLYIQGAKAACKAKDLYHYKCFGQPQVEEFGMGHPNTVAMLEYCKNYDMNLWPKEDD